VALVRHLHSVEDQLSVRGGEDVAHGLDIQHTLADKARLGGLMAGPAISNDGDPVGVCQVLADHQMSVHVQNSGIGQAQTGELFVGDGFRCVDKLFHLHIHTSSKLLTL
jgi:hypothetical protein